MPIFGPFLVMQDTSSMICKKSAHVNSDVSSLSVLYQDYKFQVIYALIVLLSDNYIREV